jgi:DNA-binding transcriptional MerR regulator
MDKKPLPPIPAKRYFTIGEVSDLCAVKPYVLRYWEQEFTQLKPMKRRGNRRYYQHHEVLLIRRICDLLYEQGFTISGARNQLSDKPSLGAVPAPQPAAVRALSTPASLPRSPLPAPAAPARAAGIAASAGSAALATRPQTAVAVDAQILTLPVRDLAQVRHELKAIRALLGDG